MSEWSPAPMLQRIAKRYADAQPNVGNRKAYAAKLAKAWRAEPDAQGVTVFQWLERWQYAGLSADDAEAAAWAMVTDAPPASTTPAAEAVHHPADCACAGTGMVCTDTTGQGTYARCEAM